MPSSWRTWNRSWICTSSPTTRIAPSCAWMSSRCNWSRKRARRWPPRRRVPDASTTSTNGPARPRSSCSANRWRVGGRRRPEPGLNTHTKGAFYEVFEPVRARELVRRLEFCYTPKHGSWLNIAENELSAMTRQCLRERGVDWQMRVDDARCKLKSVYPNLDTGERGLTARGAAALRQGVTTSTSAPWPAGGARRLSRVRSTALCAAETARRYESGTC